MEETKETQGLPRWHLPSGMVKNLPANAGDTRDAVFRPWVGNIPWRKEWELIPLFLPGKSHGQRSLAGYSPRSYKELDTTEHTHGEGNGTPLRYSCLENPMDGGAWWAAVHGVAKSWTQLSDFTFTHWRRKVESESEVAWRIPGTGEPGGLLSRGSHRVGHD